MRILFRTSLLVAALAVPLSAAPARVGQQAATTAEHPRLLPLQGGQNFRDLGGYRTTDGRMVKWGRIYRSGAMSRLTPEDFAYLATIGIDTVVDFRDTRERTSEPVNWPAAAKPKVLARDYSMDHGQFMTALFQPGLTAEGARASMAGLYRDVPVLFADQYRTLFAELLATDAPLAFNCSAGKDRTGVAAAILLSLLGVDRETVIQDYLLSNRHFKPWPAKGAGDPATEMLKRLPPEAIEALMGVERRYLEASFATIDGHPGGLTGYARDKLGLGAEQIAALKAKYLTSPEK